MVVRLYELHQAGNTLNEILEQLEKEFPDQLVPDRTTVFRRLKKVRDEVKKDLLDEDLPFE